MSHYVGKRSERKVGVSISDLPDPTKMAMWKAMRKRLAIPEGGGEACIRNDPEFGLTPYTRRFGVELNKNVEAQNKEFAACATVINNVFDNIKIKYKVPTSTGESTRYAKHTRVTIDGKTYYTTRQAVRYAMSLCRTGQATTEEEIIKKLKELMDQGKLTLYTEEWLKEKYPNAEVIDISG